MPFNAAASVINTGLGFGQSAMNNAFARREAGKQRGWSEAQINKAWERDQYAWNQQNEYNSPTAQMARFKEAGLNPHLIYGKGSPGNASPPPKANVAKGEHPWRDIKGDTNVLGNYLDLKMKSTQVDNQEQIGENLKQDARAKKAKADILETFDVPNASSKLSHFKEYYPAKLAQMGADINNKIAQTNMSQKNKEWLQMVIDEYIKTGVNINKDSYKERIGGGVLQEIYNKTQEWFNQEPDGNYHLTPQNKK